MSGDVPVVSFASTTGLSSLVDAVAEVVGADPGDHFVLAGGLAVLARLGAATRATQDIDAVTGSEATLVRIITSLPSAELDGMNLSVAGVPVDVLGVDPTVTWDEIAAVEDFANRIFAASHLWCISQGTPMVLASAKAQVELRVASTRSLLMMKLGAYLARRRDPTKTTSDAHDLYGLLRVCAADRSLRAADVPYPVSDVACIALSRIADETREFRHRISLGSVPDLPTGEVLSGLCLAALDDLEHPEMRNVGH